MIQTCVQSNSGTYWQSDSSLICETSKTVRGRGMQTRSWLHESESSILMKYFRDASALIIR